MTSRAHRARRASVESGGAALLPRISIETTPANDLYLMLGMLLPTAEVARLLSDPASFARSHRAELRFVSDMLRSRSAPAPSEANALEPTRPASAERVRGSRSSPANDAPARDAPVSDAPVSDAPVSDAPARPRALGRHESLLR